MRSPPAPQTRPAKRSSNKSKATSSTSTAWACSQRSALAEAHTAVVGTQHAAPSLHGRTGHVIESCLCAHTPLVSPRIWELPSLSVSFHPVNLVLTATEARVLGCLI